MAMLGDILAEARRSSGPLQTLMRGTMPDLMAEIEEAADISGESTADYVGGAFTAFSQLASEEDWATLISSMRDSADPGMACLLTMVQWRLAMERSAMGVAAAADQGSGE
ncbi:hypothetical protein [Microbaculum marinum]|uniref:Uncharacterized protein n=1 Tax=Microbaculum marinum TaxID=1764581 RepID=A0AAW9RJB7_9HYPH